MSWVDRIHKEAVRDVRELTTRYWGLMAQTVPHDTLDSVHVVCSLAERMAMYDWYWGLSLQQLKEYGIFYDQADIPFNQTIEARVLEIWREKA